MASLNQNTFTIVPNAPRNVLTHGAPPAQPAAASRPPMTSKRARKLYNQQTKVPKRTKAEQRLWEREEQERIRKELEREQNAVKARAARERKKAKDQAALDEKKRLGLPLISVRPSQDTISRFIRKAAKSAGARAQQPPQRDQLERLSRSPGPGTGPGPGPGPGPDPDSDSSASAGLAHQGQRLNVIEEQGDNCRAENQPESTYIISGHEKRPCLGGEYVLAQDATEVQPPNQKNNASTAREEIITDPGLLEQSSSQNGQSATSKPAPMPSLPPLGDILPETIAEELVLSPHELDMACKSSMLVSEAPAPDKKKTPCATGEKRKITEAEQVAASGLTTIPTAASIARQDCSHLNKHGTKPKRQKLRFSTTGGQVHHAEVKPPHANGRYGQGSMLPPPLPQVRKPLAQLPSAVVTQTPHISSPPGDRIAKDDEQKPEAFLPSSTQLFLLNHIDDIIPTPSQEARELFGDENKMAPRAAPPPSRSAPLQRGVFSRPKPLSASARPKATEAVSAARNSIRSRQKFTCHAAARGQITQHDQRPRSCSTYLATPATKQHRAPAPPIPDLEFFSTQDVMLSSQDVREVEQPVVTVTRTSVIGPSRFLKTGMSKPNANAAASKSAMANPTCKPAPQTSQNKTSNTQEPTPASQNTPRSVFLHGSNMTVEALFESHDNMTAARACTRPRNRQVTPAVVAENQVRDSPHGPRSLRGQGDAQKVHSKTSQRREDGGPRGSSGSTDSDGPDPEGRPRYFTSSCTNIRMGLARLDSFKTFEAEERRRQVQLNKQSARSRTAEVQYRQEAALAECPERQSRGRSGQTPSSQHRPQSPAAHCSPTVAPCQADLAHLAEDLVRSLEEDQADLAASTSHVKADALTGAASAAILPSTQETDYGDFDIGESLAMLEAEGALL